ncbi:Ulp1 family isopeptidase [Roseateles sp. MS654]|uniref:Ulp1 family isopeptidase n=1 Tax=Roseateles sp. MS654 TaxID=3412685 RepID=UPI003C2CBCEF
MDFPGNTGWYNNLEAYRKLREEAGVPAVDAVATPASPTAAEYDEVANQLAHLGLQGRRRASESGPALAPRGALSDLGRSMRQPPTAALVGRDNYSQSARMPYVPESSPDGSEPYVPQPARHSSAYASHAPHPDAAPRRKGGLMSGLGKGIKKAFGFGSSGRSASSRHSVDSSSFRQDSTLRLDPHSPGRELARSVIEEAADAQVTRHHSPPPDAPAAQAPERQAPPGLSREEVDFMAAFSRTPWMANASTNLRGKRERQLRAFADWLRAEGRRQLHERSPYPELLADVAAFRAHAGSRNTSLLEGVVTHLHEAVENNEIDAAPVAQDPRSIARTELGKQIVAILSLAPPGTPPMVSDRQARYAGMLCEFDDWLYARNHPTMAAFLPGCLEALRPALEEYFAIVAMGKRTSHPNVRTAFNALCRFGTAQAKAQTPALPPLVATPYAWSRIEWPDDAQPQEPAARRPRLTQPGMTGIYDALSPIVSDAHFSGFHRGSPSAVEQPAPSIDRIFGGLSPITSRGYTFDLNQEAEEQQRASSPTASEATGPYRAPLATDVVDVESYESIRPEEFRETAAERLSRPNAYLHDDDFGNYGAVIGDDIARNMGADAHAQFIQTIGIVDALRARLLGGRHTSERVRGEVLREYRTPVLFLPVNNAEPNILGDHWSLLVVNRTTGVAFHYDSSVDPARLADPAFRERLSRGRSYKAATAMVQGILGQNARPVLPAPMARQRDNWSCGDHVLAGMEELARRMISTPGQNIWNLSGIQPNRAHIAAALIQYEADQPLREAARAAHQQGAQAAAAATFASTSGAAGPSRTAPDIGYLVGDDWRHGPHPQPATDLMIAVLDTHNLLPTRYNPQIAVQIHGRPYVAYLAQGGPRGTVWLAPRD